jgi:cytochrome oxidase Cu insertion factor (SCO1/SenC/PrrC family)
MKRPAWQLLAIAALSFGPFIAALLLYSGRDSFGGFDQFPNPDRELLAEPQAMPLEPLRLAGGGMTEPDWSRSRWSLIHARFAPCDAGCDAALARLRQVWLALGGERDRVQLLLLAPEGAAPAAVPPDFLPGVIDASAGDPLVRLLGRERLEQGRYFVVDPLGNIILSYPDTADQQRLLEDLERLLTVSRVG